MSVPSRTSFATVPAKPNSPSSGCAKTASARSNRMESSLAESSIRTAVFGYGCHRTRTQVRRPHAGHRTNEWYLRRRGRCTEKGKALRTSWSGLIGVSRWHEEQSTRNVPAKGCRPCEENRTIFPSGSRSGGMAFRAAELGCRDFEFTSEGRRRTLPPRNSRPLPDSLICALRHELARDGAICLRAGVGRRESQDRAPVA